MIGRTLAGVFLLLVRQEPGLSKAEVAAFEKAQLEGAPFPAADPEVVHSLTVALPSGRELGVRVLLPEGYDGRRPLPLLVAMGGGPAPDADLARDQARQMAANWWALLKKRGWILAVIEDTVSLVRPGKDLRYDALLPEDFRAAIDSVQKRFNVHANRVCATGVSLGANYAIQFAAHRPDWFAAIVPVSSEGESREAVLRNLGGVSVYALNGARDRTIRTIDGPRKMAEILKKLGNRVEYEELEEGGHDSFRDRYEDLLPWLEKAVRNPWPKVVVRVPHDGLFPTSRQHYWVVPDSDQALVRAEVAGQTITVTAARCQWLKIALSDALVDLDRPVTIVANGQEVFSGKVERMMGPTPDRGVVIGGSLRVRVPLDDRAREAARRWTSTLAPTVAEAKLPWWELYARATRSEGRHRPVWEGEPVEHASGLVAYRLTSVEPDSPEGRAGIKVGDVVRGFEDEYFYTDGDGLSLVGKSLLHLPRAPQHYTLKILRDGNPVPVVVPLVGVAGVLDFAVEALKEGAPVEVSEAIRKELAGAGTRVLRDGKPFIDFWFRAALPTGEARKGPGILYPTLKPCGLVGVARIHPEGADFKGQKFPAGVYTMRYEEQPDDGDHAGTVESRDFLLLGAAGLDGSPDVMDPKALRKLSAKAAGRKHPAVLYLVGGKGGVLPGIARDEAAKRTIFEVEVPATGGKPLRLSIVIVGKVME